MICTIVGQFLFKTMRLLTFIKYTAGLSSLAHTVAFNASKYSGAHMQMQTGNLKCSTKNENSFYNNVFVPACIGAAVGPAIVCSFPGMAYALCTSDNLEEGCFEYKFNLEVVDGEVKNSHK